MAKQDKSGKQPRRRKTDPDPPLPLIPVPVSAETIEHAVNELRHLDRRAISYTDPRGEYAGDRAPAVEPSFLRRLIGGR